MSENKGAIQSDLTPWVWHNATDWIPGYRLNSNQSVDVLAWQQDRMQDYVVAYYKDGSWFPGLFEDRENFPINPDKWTYIGTPDFEENYEGEKDRYKIVV